MTRKALGSQILVLLVILAALIVFFVAMRPDAFLSVANIRNMATDAAILLVLATGGTIVILAAGIDLSVNGVLVFSGVIAAMTMVAVGGDGIGTILIGLVAGIVAGSAWGLLNGFLVSIANIPALIVTLGTMGMAFGAAFLLTGGIDISNIPQDLVLSVGSGRILGIPWLVIIAVVVVLIGVLLLRSTTFGRHTYAIGSNTESARRAGIHVSRHLVCIYLIAGCLSGLAGFLALARFANTTLGGHSTENLAVIAAVVIGGTSLFGGSGGLGGTVIGVMIPVVLLNGFVIIGLPPFWQQVAVGAILIVAVFFDQLRRSRRDS
jgi:ribose transport system permease protein